MIARRTAMLYGTIAAAMASFLTGTVIIWAQLAIAPPPIAWQYIESLPASPLCPGDAVDYRIGMEVNRAGALYVIAPIRRAADHPAVATAVADLAVGAANTDAHPTIGDTAIGVMGSGVFFTAIAPEEVPGYLVDIDTRFIVPDLPPGPYNRIVAAGLYGSNARQAIRTQRFVVAEDCP